MAGGAFQIRSKRWDVGVLIGSLVVLLVGFGGLFLLQKTDSAGDPTLWFIVFLGIVTFAFFAGPGIVYVLRKRVAWVKKTLPGGTMPWIRSHLYLPILALVTAFVHATIVPFRAHLSSGKVLLVLGILVSIAGVARHHLIGVQKAALNVNVAISKLSTGQPRDFRRLVADFTDTARPVEEIDAAMAQFPHDLQERWGKIKALRAEVDKHFPRTGGQRLNVRSYKVWRALHPPLTILLFAVLAFHVWDVLGGTTKFFRPEKEQFVAASSCAGCHSRTYSEWATSSMQHAQTSTITEAQLPVTLAVNRELVDNAVRDNNGLLPANNQGDNQVNQADLFNSSAKVCLTCHAQVGARFAPNNDSLVPLGDSDSAGVKAKGTAISGANGALNDGVGCQTCHGTSKPPSEMQSATGFLNDEKAAGGTFGSVFAPLFENPNPLPQRIHDIGNGEGGFWNDPVKSSQLCGSCHDVKIDLQGDGLAVDPNADPTDPNAPDTNFGGDDTKATPITDPATAADHDSNGDLTLDENKTDPKHDVVLQTTYDEWQDYVAFFDAPGGFKERYSKSVLGDTFGNPNDSPLGCSDCHMPLQSKDDPTAGVVDHAPGLLPIPQRDYREHTFVGVDYDLDPSKYDIPGVPSNALDKALADREALVRSAVTLKVEPNGGLFAAANPGLATQPDANGDPQPGKLVTFTVNVRNNLLAHTFPTGFAFARQFWLQVAATTKDGKPICLSAPFVAGNGSVPVTTPCTSGVLGVDARTAPSDAVKKASQGPSPNDVDTDLRSCDPNDVANALGLDVATMKADLAATPPKAPTDPATGITIQNLDVRFARTFGNDNCDPWLTNFQKILTDGDPQQTGTKTEVSYQSFVPNLVQIRGRVATGQAVTDLQPVRLAPDPKNPANLVSQDTGSFDYTFFVPDNLGIADPADIVVNARMEFRHLPPYFVTDLAQAQQDIIDKGFNVPPDARIFDDGDHPHRLEDLLSHMTITEVGSATSADGDESLGCDKGPQNVVGGTIRDCVRNDTPQHTVEGPGFAAAGNALPPGHPPLVEAAGLSSDSGRFTLGSGVALVALAPLAWRRSRRRRPRRARAS